MVAFALPPPQDVLVQRVAAIGRPLTVADAYRVRDEPAEVKRRAVETVEAGDAPTLAGAVKRIKQEEAREQAIAEATNTAAVPNLLTAPVGELEAVIGPGSVDIIATMPPTARGSVEGGVVPAGGHLARRGGSRILSGERRRQRRSDVPVVGSRTWSLRRRTTTGGDVALSDIKDATGPVRRRTSFTGLVQSVTGPTFSGGHSL